MVIGGHCRPSSVRSLNNFSGRIKGFTLVEFIMVLTIILTGAFIVIPRVIVFLDDIQIESRGRQVAADLRYTQQSAISKQKNFKFEIDFAGRDYYIFEQTTVFPYWLQVQHKKLDEHIIFYTATLPAPGFIDSSLPNKAIDFDPLGSPMPFAGGTIILKHVDSGLTQSILIANVTGHVEIQ